jgi:hypothetical protein
MTTTSTGLQADNDCNSSLNDVTAPQAFPATTVTTIVTMTQVPTMTTAITKATIKHVECFLHPAKTGANNATVKSESLLLNDQIGSAITAALNAQNLLLLSVQDDSAIMLAMRTIYSLQLIVESFSIGTKQVAPATIHNDLFKLIVALASEGTRFAPYIFDNAFTYTNKLNHEGVRAQATSFQASKLIVNYFEISFHFCVDCRIFCEGEWQVKDKCYDIVKQRSANTQEWDTLVATASIGCVSLVGCINYNGLVDLNGIAGRTGPNGLIGVNDIFGNIDRNNQIIRNNLVGL